MCCSFRCVGAPLFRFGERVEVLGDRPTPKKSCGFRGCVVECLPKGREDRDLGYHGKVRGSDGTTVYVSCRLRNPMKRFTEYAPHPINLLPLVSRRKAICGSSRKGRRGRNAWDVLSRANGGVQERRGGGGRRRERRHEGGSFLRHTGHRPRVEEAAHVLHENGRAPQPDGKPTDRDNRTFRPTSR